MDIPFVTLHFAADLKPNIFTQSNGETISRESVVAI